MIVATAVSGAEGVCVSVYVKALVGGCSGGL
jgi:hypothetical protein